jgi:tetratricopeptide (TPR) repeat protein
MLADCPLRNTRPLTSSRATRTTVVVLAFALLCAIPSVAAAREWVLARSPGFIVVSDAGEKKARQVAHQFEQVRGLFQQVLQARVDPSRLVVILAVKDEQGLRELLPGYWERKGGSHPAGIFVPGRDKHLVALRLDVATEKPYHVIYHEYTHLLTRLNVRWVPLWLSEGLAEFYAASEIDEQEVRWGLMQANHLRYLRRAPLVKLDELLAADHSSPLYNDAKRTPAFYAQSAVLTHYLLLGAPQRRGQITELFKLLESDVPESEALRRAFGDLKKLDAELTTYVRRFSFPAVKTETRIDPQGIRTASLTAAQADALRGDFLTRTGRPREARPLLEAAVQQEPDLGWAHEALGALEWSGGRTQEALRRFNDSAKFAPANYVAHFRAGLIEEEGKEAKADAERREQSLRRSLETNPSFAPALAAISRLLSGQPGRSEEAVSSARKACALDPAATRHRVDLWQALRRAERNDEAAGVEAELLRIALRDRPVLGEVVAELEDIQRVDDAEALLRKARAASPRSAMVAELLADFLERQEKTDEAVALLREALAADPDSFTLQSTLAYVLADTGGKPEEGLALIERALKQAPDNPALLDTKGWALFRLDRLSEAEAILRVAAEGTDHAVILEHLGDVWLAQGRVAEALTQYERALAARTVTKRQRITLQQKIERTRNPVSVPSPAAP